VPLKDIKEQTATRKAAGVIPTYPPAPAPVTVPLRTLPCVHEGNVLERCHTCKGDNPARHVRECDKFERCTRGFVSGKIRACVTCEEYTVSTTDT